MLSLIIMLTINVVGCSITKIDKNPNPYRLEPFDIKKTEPKD